jgi:hypothetical protein
MTTRSDYLKKKIQIGSSNGLINYTPSQTVFHHDEINTEKRERKRDVKAWVKQDKLVLSKHEWNRSTDPNTIICERRTMENFVKDRSRGYQYNFRAETLPPSNADPIDMGTKYHISTQKPDEIEIINKIHESNRVLAGQFTRTTEWMIHPNLRNAKEWEHSTLLTDEQKKDAYDNLMNSSMKHTRMKNKTIQPNGYISPIQRTISVQDEVRKLKKTNSFDKDRPVFQTAEAPVNRRALVNRYAIEPSRKFKTTKHSGVWSFNAAEGRYMWSDTGSFEYNSRGDIETICNPDGYNFSNPSMSGTDQNY